MKKIMILLLCMMLVGCNPPKGTNQPPSENELAKAQRTRMIKELDLVLQEKNKVSLEFSYCPSIITFLADKNNYSAIDLAKDKELEGKMNLCLKKCLPYLEQRAATERKEFAKKLEYEFLDKMRYDVKCSVSGKYNTKLKIEGVLVGRAFAHQVMKSMGETFRKYGFKKVWFVSYYKGWEYDL